HRLDVLISEQLAIVLILRRTGADDRRGLGHFDVVEIADSGAMAVVDFGEMFQKVRAAAAGTDDAVFHLVGSGTHLQDGGPGSKFGNGCSGGNNAGRLHHVAPRGALGFGHGAPSEIASLAEGWSPRLQVPALTGPRAYAWGCRDTRNPERK